jgi:hypothetical protein
MNAAAHQSLGEIWVYLSTSPLLGLTLTLLAYQGAVWLNQRCKGHLRCRRRTVAVCTAEMPRSGGAGFRHGCRFARHRHGTGISAG